MTFAFELAGGAADVTTSYGESMVVHGIAGPNLAVGGFVRPNLALVGLQTF